jgi:hypothetical protein
MGGPVVLFLVVVGAPCDSPQLISSRPLLLATHLTCALVSTRPTPRHRPDCKYERCHDLATSIKAGIVKHETSPSNRTHKLHSGSHRVLE